MDTEQPPLLCHRCGAALTAGEGNFYVVRIEAFADPTPPTIPAEQLDRRDTADRLAELYRQMADMTEQELMDQVYRRLVLHLCGPCYRAWIEDPADPPPVRPTGREPA